MEAQGDPDGEINLGTSFVKAAMDLHGADRTRRILPITRKPVRLLGSVLTLQASGQMRSNSGYVPYRRKT